MLCDVVFLVANAFKIDIKSCKDNLVYIWVIKWNTSIAWKQSPFTT